MVPMKSSMQRERFGESNWVRGFCFYQWNDQLIDSECEQTIGRWWNCGRYGMAGKIRSFWACLWRGDLLASPCYHVLFPGLDDIRSLPEPCTSAIIFLSHWRSRHNGVGQHHFGPSSKTWIKHVSCFQLFLSDVFTVIEC